jgi:glycosyltransferase involved in cell wall biosynthesis
MKIAWFSPLEPEHSGICDYSENLLPLLARSAEIDIFYGEQAAPETELRDHCGVYSYHDFSRFESRYDAICYHLGNNELHRFAYDTLLAHPGCVVMHDWVLHHFYAASTIKRGRAVDYFEEFRYNEGEEGAFLAREFYKKQRGFGDFFFEHPLNRRPLEAASGVIVHSKYLLKNLDDQLAHKPACRIPMYCVDQPQGRRDIELMQAAGFNPDDLVIAAFGFITQAKRLDSTLSAVKRLADDGFPVRLALIGEPAPGYAGELNDLVDRSGIRDRVFISNFVDNSSFSSWLDAIDIGLALRHPTAGETSSAAIRMMGAGKPVIMSDIVQARDYPKDTVKRVPIDENEEEQLYRTLKSLTESPEQRQKLGNRASRFIAEQHSLQQAAEMYLDFLSNYGRPPARAPRYSRTQWLGATLGSPQRELVFETEAELGRIMIEVGGQIGLFIGADRPHHRGMFSRWLTNPLYRFHFLRKFYFQRVHGKFFILMQFYILYFLRRKLFRRGLPTPLRKLGRAAREMLTK